jgi:asparagine synthase (glutamine-hydrolysing)
VSVQFGRWNFEGQAPTANYIDKVNATLAPYGPDSNESYSKGGINILYYAFHTTKESHRETQPHVFASEAVLTWDGRLDNRAELIGELHDSLNLNSTDVEIVAAAFQRWGDKCLGKLIGDWALSIWNPRERHVLLAKDPIGTKHLFYAFDDKQLTWSTILDPLVLFADKTFMICEEYIASWLTNQFPAAHLTPYIGIQAVPPSCCVVLRPGKYGTKHSITTYWGFDPDTRIRYRTNAEFEEHFRSAFATAVQRRLRSDRPVLAELSGGMDSSSIVCMADLIMGAGTQRGARHSSLAASPVECPRLDTISWFGDFYAHLEPDTNEFHWISKVEQQRGRTGFHINANELKSKETRSRQPFMSAFDSGGFASTPAPRTLSRFFKLYAAHIASEGHRVTFSGVGGDHVTGREPTPLPELQDLLARGHFVTLALHLNMWATTLNEPRISLLWEVLHNFFPHRRVTNDVFAAPWFRAEFIHRNYLALRDCPPRMKLFTHLPSSQHNLAGLDGERRSVAYLALNPHLIRDIRYPYLDRDLLSFMYAIPREQVVGAGQHRFLMRRALAGIVPDEILNRHRKVFLRPQSDKDNDNTRSVEVLRSLNLGEYMVTSSISIIDPKRFSQTLQTVTSKDESILRMLTQTIKLESWLRHLTDHGVLAAPQPSARQRCYSPSHAKDIPSCPTQTVQLASSCEPKSTIERR